jgi:chromosomal replication initiator protein
MGPGSLQHEWARVSNRLKSEIGETEFARWLAPLTPQHLEDGAVSMAVPTKFLKNWVASHYADRIQRLWSGENPDVARIEIVVARIEDGLSAADAAPLSIAQLGNGLGRIDGADGPKPIGETLGGLPALEEEDGLIGLDPRFTFENFVVGKPNELAHAAARRVAESEHVPFNPLFLYGGVGLGKTHLMHAIGHYVLRHDHSLKLTYISSERFMNEMINAVRYDRILDFRERYRSVDVLLVDDIQFVSGKEGTQTEFFHTFNALYDAQKQIVLSSDRPPHEIPALEERLRSRFEWGLIADIQPPDLETKVAILKRKAEGEAVPLPDNVAMYIAGRIKSNIRELEGSLIRLIAFASLTGRDISLELTQEVLKNVIDQDDKAVTIETIQKFVSDYYQLKVGELKSRNNSKSIAMPRQIAMYLCKTLTHASLPEIGRSFGGKHHSTVIHSIKKIEDLRKKDGVFNSLIANFLESFR